ncbi:MAG: hypothetical protein PVI57_11590 [Gemmatimonadota bacterium]|jgi:hypothetical protein
MKRFILSSVALGVVGLAACTPSEVVVTAEIEQAPEGGATPLENVIIELIPFDRDQVFDSLAAEAATPEPEIPAELVAAREEIAQARTEWQTLESRWNTLRDTLQSISDALEQYNRGEARYVTLYQDFQDMESEYNRVDRQVEGAFERYDSLSKASLEQSERVRIQRQNWADEAFAEVGDVFEAHLRASGRDLLADTTSADGIARFSGMGDGDWWVHARFETPNAELYWNVPISVPKGEVLEVRLTRDNAEERPNL